MSQEPSPEAAVADRKRKHPFGIAHMELVYGSEYVISAIDFENKQKKKQQKKAAVASAQQETAAQAQQEIAAQAPQEAAAQAPQEAELGSKDNHVSLSDDD